MVDSWFGKGSGFCYTLTLDMLNHVDTENNDTDNGLFSIRAQEGQQIMREHTPYFD